MSVVTLEGVVEHNRIRLLDNVQLPDNTRVYVIVPGIQVEQVAHVYSPRLALREQALDFKMEIIEEPPAPAATVILRPSNNRLLQANVLMLLDSRSDFTYSPNCVRWSA